MQLCFQHILSGRQSAVWCWCIRPLRVKSPRLGAREVTQSQSQSESTLGAVRALGAEGCDLGSLVNNVKQLSN